MTTDLPLTLPAEYFQRPSEPEPARIETATGRVSGYLPALPVTDPDDVHIPEDFASSAALNTTNGPVAVGRLYVTVTGQKKPDPSLTTASVRAYYSQVAHTAGWIATGIDERGLWVAGAVTSPLLSLDERTMFAEAQVEGDFRTHEGRAELAAVHINAPAYEFPHLALRHAATKGELVRLLTTGALADAPDDTPLIMAKDADGNGYSPLSDIDRVMYLPETPWCGEVYPRDEDVNANDPDSENDLAPEGAVPAILLDPTN